MTNKRQIYQRGEYRIYGYLTREGDAYFVDMVDSNDAELPADEGYSAAAIAWQVAQVQAQELGEAVT